MRIHFTFAAALTALLHLLASPIAYAQIPETLHYAGKLEREGKPYHGRVETTFELFDSETGGQPVWQEQHPALDVQEGRFIVDLGSAQPVRARFDGRPLWLQVTINGEALWPRTTLASLPYAFKAGLADQAREAQTLGGMTAAQIQQGARPRADQITYQGATSGLNATDVQAALDELAQLRARVSALEAATRDSAGDALDLGALATTVQALGAAQAQTTTTLTTLQTTQTTQAQAINALQNEVATLQIPSALDARVAQLERKTASLTVDAAGHNVYLTGVNLHIRSGLGATNGNPADPRQMTVSTAVNGRGNLIIGYDEAHPTASDKSGSHNLVLGVDHSYSSFGGLVAGRQNTISAPFAVASGGHENVATGLYSTIHGGYQNASTSFYSHVSGGRGNESSGSYSSITGGQSNKATHTYSSVTGGLQNTASALHSAISGGSQNIASGSASHISGGTNNIANGPSSHVSGGQTNRAFGGASSVLGGENNQAVSPHSSISGGSDNLTSSPHSHISGGYQNNASGQHSHIGGGRQNNALGQYTVVSGGLSRSASVIHQWRAGSLLEAQ